MGWNEFIGITVLFYALANPIGVIPIFLGITHKLNDVNVPKVIVTACVAVAAFLAVSNLLGRQILTFFHVELDDFRIAGGLLTLYTAFEMFQAHYGGILQTLEEKAEAEKEAHNIAITPLAFPLLVGPAEMSNMITMTNDMPLWKDKVMLLVSSLVVTLLIAITLWMAAPIKHAIGKTGINVATRGMALVVASIGIHFIMTGIKNQIPVLKG